MFYHAGEKGTRSGFGIIGRWEIEKEILLRCWVHMKTGINVDIVRFAVILKDSNEEL